MQDRRVDLGSCHLRACLPGTTRLVRYEPLSAKQMLRIISQHPFACHRCHTVCLATYSLLWHGIQRDRSSSACRRFPLHLVLPWGGSMLRMFCMVCMRSHSSTRRRLTLLPAVAISYGICRHPPQVSAIDLTSVV